MTAEIVDPNFLLKYAIGLLDNMGLDPSYSHLTATIAVALLTLLVAWGIYAFLTRVVVKYVVKLTKFTSATWDDILFDTKVLNVVCEVLLTVFLQFALPRALSLYPEWSEASMVMCQILTVVASVHLVNRIILALYYLLEEKRGARVTALKGIRQMLQVISILVGLIIVISILAHRDPLIIISGLGAAATVLMLVFKDPIMGVVAGVQLTLNDMLRPGDWISVPSRNINGIVKEVGLATVKVQNFDMTIVTVPPYSLLSESFQNWRGMVDSGGRRVQRSVCIDLNSVRYLTAEERKAVEGEEWFAPLADGREVANITAFRHYLKHAIATTPTVKTDMTWMVRELAPTPQGLPVEFYFFTSHTSWVEYEEFQAGVFDRVLADVNRFGLRVYQAPSGLDLLSLKQ
ncbi:MAG: mechanosensitive ion channel family protein [Duncaniella sp.]|nr:mechanosensitive ion channel family protein [Duncaniella sp.]